MLQVSRAKPGNPTSSLYLKVYFADVFFPNLQLFHDPSTNYPEKLFFLDKSRKK